MSDFRRNIKPGQRFEYGMYQFLDHFLGRERVFKMLGKRRKKYYKKLTETLKASGEGKVMPMERRRDLSLKEFKNHYVKKGIPVVMEGAAKDWACANKWSMEYFKDLHGEDDIILVDQKIEGYPFEKIKLKEVIDNIRSGGKKYYRFYPLLARHPEHIADFDYKWLLDRKKKPALFDLFQVFMGGQGTITNFHNSNPPNLFVQAYGQKEWIVYSHYYTPIVDPIPVRNAYRNAPYKKNGAPFDPFNPDYESPYTLWKYIDGYQTVLQPGDVLWVPPFYWHAVRNNTDSIGVGYRWVAPFYAFKVSPLYMFLDMFSTNPTLLKSYKLTREDSNLIWLAESGKLEEYLKGKERRGETEKDAIENRLNKIQ